ncbi:MAG: nitrogenase-associated protein [Halochromatium sp.]|nr:nitrogenase-associated protein [Halochromatium sp.]
MTEVIFYEKPGCIGNAKQKRLLAKRKHLLVVRDILSERWSGERLRPFFGDMPVSAWFNPTAPRVKNGEVVPANLSEDEALALMIAEPLLIRRPLIETPSGRCAGFEAGPVLSALGIQIEPDEDLQSCARAEGQPDCEPTPSATNTATPTTATATAATATAAPAGLGATPA